MTDDGPLGEGETRPEDSIPSERLRVDEPGADWTPHESETPDEAPDKPGEPESPPNDPGDSELRRGD